jgi:hypothetical protein
MTSGFNLSGVIVAFPARSLSSMDELWMLRCYGQKVVDFVMEDRPNAPDAGFRGGGVRSVFKWMRSSQA